MTVTLIESGLQRLLNSETGPIGRDTLRRGEAVLQRAFVNASGGMVRSRSGDLAAGLRLTMLPGPSATVSSTASHRGYNYGLGLERGTPAHPITSSKYLISGDDNPDTFPSPNLASRRNYPFLFKSVNHPGTVAYHWLSDALEAARV